MTSDDRRDEVAEAPDLELVTSFLNGQLDPERVKQVRQRLEDDPAFREFAAPLILAWSVPPHWQRHARPVGELEKHWDRFTKEAGFVHQRRKARRRMLWIIGLVVVALGVSVFSLRDRVAGAIAIRRDFEDVRADSGWITLRDGTLVRLEPGARLRQQKKVGPSGLHVRLSGTARFRAEPPDTGRSPIPLLQPIAVWTRNADVFTPRAEFSVSVRGDTTDVTVHRPTRRAFASYLPMPSNAFVLDRVSVNPVPINETEVVRVVRGSKAKIVGRSP